MPKYLAKTPSILTEAITRFCLSLEPTTPIWVPVNSTPDAEMGRCYLNVEKEIDRVGGVMRLGWLIWELPRIYLTAEHHAVLEVNGVLRDVTPPLADERSVLFLPEAKPFHAPEYMPNRYMPLDNHPLLERACYLQERNQQLFNEGMFRSPEFDHNDQEVCRCIEQYKELLLQRQQRARLHAKRKAERKRRR